MGVQFPTTPSGDLQDRIKKAAEVMKITEDAVWAMLGKIGVEKDDGDALSVLDATDFQRMLQQIGNDLTPPGVKPARLALGFAALNGRTEDKPKNVASILEQHVAQSRPISQYKDKEILEMYNQDCPTDVVDQLRKRSNDRPFVVFNDNNETIDVDNSVQMLRIARHAETKSTHVIVTPDGNKAVRLYRVGEFPATWVEESPIHRDVILVDGYCEKCGDTWNGVPMEDRVLIRVAHMAGYVKESKADVARLIDDVRLGGAKHLLKILAVKLLYDDLEGSSQLPVLRRKLSASKSGTKDPLFVHRSY